MSEPRKGDAPSAPLPDHDQSSFPPLAVAVGAPYGASYSGYGAAPPSNPGYAYSGVVPGYQGGSVPSPGLAYGAAYANPSGGYADSQTAADLRDHIMIGRWAADLCACLDSCVPNCFMAWCCPCVSLAQIYARVGLLPYRSALGYFVTLGVIGWIGYFFSPPSIPVTATYRNDPGYETAAIPMAFSLIMTIDQVIFRIVIWFVRFKVRERFQIPGGICGDGCTSCCCSCCAIAQLATHVKSYTPGSCDFSGPDVLPACQI